MRELRLKYFIELLSNLESKSQSDAQALEGAQRRIQRELKKTETELGVFERTLLRVGRMEGAGLQRQAIYLGQIAQSALRAQQAVEKFGNAMGVAHKGLQSIQGGLAAGVGAFMVAKTALDKPVDYDTRLRRATSTAFAGKDIHALRAGQVQINELINGTVRDVRGASRDDTLGAFEKLIGSGSFSYDEAKALLPTIMKTSVAGGAQANDLVQAAEKMKVQLGLKPHQVGEALAKVMRAGQEGGFEIKDSAKWIGPLLPYMKGYKGMDAVERLVTMLQQVRSTAGTNDEAANNLRNFLQKMGADSTTKDFKKQGIDLPGEMAKGAARGESPVDTYMRQLDKVMMKNDPEGKARRAMREVDADKTLSPEEKKERYQQVGQIFKDANVAKIINDLQEFGGYSGLMKTQEYGKKVFESVRAEKGGTVQTGYDYMAEGTGAKITDLANRKDIAMSDALANKSGPLNAAIDKTIELADKFPGLAAASASATVALGALAVAAGAASIVSPGKTGVAAKVGGWLSGSAGKLAALFGGWKIASGLAPASVPGGAIGAGAGAASRLAPWAAGLYAAYDVYKIADAGLQLHQAKNRQGVTLTADAKERLRMLDASRVAESAWGGEARGAIRPPDFLSLTTPGEMPQNLQLGKNTEIKVGEGVLKLELSMPPGVSMTPTVTQQPSIIRISPGNTNPAGYR
jgi:Phage-related minor tail protein